MEDAHAAVLDLDGSGDKSNTFFAVYDGHGGTPPCPLELSLQLIPKKDPLLLDLLVKTFISA